MFVWQRASRPQLSSNLRLLPSPDAKGATISKMAEAEVSLRLAFWLASKGLTDGPIEVAIDGAQVKTGETLHFDLPAFLSAAGWEKATPTCGAWQATYRTSRHPVLVRIHSTSGCGDVITRLRTNQVLRVECKKGPLVASKSSQEYPLIREALGQLLTIAEVSDQDLLAVAVPSSPKFEALAERWRAAPLISRFGIRILTVSSTGSVGGFPSEAA